MNTTNEKEAAALLNKAKQQIIEDMKARGFGAILWSIPDADFHYIPEIMTGQTPDNGKNVARITGLYRYEDKLYAVEEDVAPVNFNRYYNPDVDVPPVVVTLSESKALEELGNPSATPGYTLGGSLEEWVAIADCYFEAIAEA